MNKYKKLEWTELQITKFWDYESQFPDNYFSKQVGNNIVDYLTQHFPLKKTILDYGCGPGFLIEHLLNKELQVAGLEFSKKSLQIVSQKYSGTISFMGAFDFETLIAKNLKFDIITLVEVIEHLDDYFLNLTFNNIKKVLSDDGIVFITTPNEENLEKSMLFCPNCEHVFHRWQHLRNWSVDSLTEFLLEQEFNITSINTTNFGISKIELQNLPKPTYRNRFHKRLHDLIFRISNLYSKYKINPQIDTPIIIHKQPHLFAVVQLVKK